MMQIHAQILILLLLLYVAGFSTAQDTNKVLENGTIIFSETKPSEFKSLLKTEFDDEGLGPWYELGNSFIKTVLSKEPWPIAGKALNEGIDKLNIQSDVVEGYALGMIITVGFGLLFCLLMPIVGFCFCCCRCCGNCGGEMTQKDSPRNGCKRAVFGLILTMITLIMFAGVLMTFVCNDNMSKTLEKAKETSSGIVAETTNFVNTAISEVERILKVDMSFTIEQLRNDITDQRLRELVGAPFLLLVENVVEKPIKALTDLAENSEKMEKQLDIIVNSTNELQGTAKELETGLNNTRENVSEIASTCKNMSAPLTFCDSLNAENFASDADFTNLPNVTAELDNIREVTGQDFVSAAKKGLQTVYDIPETLINKTRSTRNDISKMIQNATSTFDKYLEDMRESVNKTVVEPLRDMKTKVHEAVDVAKTYDRYRWYGGVGLTCILLLIVVLMALGLMCGICGHDKHATPSSRGTVSNMGGNCLMAATGFCFIFASFLMLLTTICFLIGAPMQGIVCEPIQAGTVFSQFLDNKEYFNPLLINKAFGINDTDIKIGQSLDNCRANMPAYRALKLNYVFNISQKLDIKELLGDSVDQQFNQLNVNLTDQTLLSNTSKQSLNKLNDSGVDNIDFEAFLNETSKAITKQNLTVLAKKLEVFAANMTDVINNNATPTDDKDKAQQMKNQSLATAAQLRILDANTVKKMSLLSGELDKNVKDLRTIGGNLMYDATKTLFEAEQAESSLHNSAGEMLQVITKYTRRVLGYGFQFTAHVLSLINNKLARCKPLTNVFDAVIILACEDFLMPFNGFWLAIGFCLFFFIPAIIFSVKLAKHYRRMSYESDFDDYNGGPDMIEMGQPVGQEKKLWANKKNAVYPNTRPAYPSAPPPY